MLTTHALAALHGHEGAARNDPRAWAIVRMLVASPPYLRHMPPAPWTSLTHAPGWSASVSDPGAAQHPVFDTQVVDGLVAAWRARRALRLEPALRRYVDGFARGANLGPGLRFHYAPSRPANDPLNVDSAEYANIVLSFAGP